MERGNTSMEATCHRECPTGDDEHFTFAAYVGPMPFLVVPRLWCLSASNRESIFLWKPNTAWREGYGVESEGEKGAADGYQCEPSWR